MHSSLLGCMGHEHLTFGSLLPPPLGCLAYFLGSASPQLGELHQPLSSQPFRHCLPTLSCAWVWEQDWMFGSVSLPISLSPSSLLSG